ncbi:hypothetical protein [Noviherbaspirillum galbum]|uniref:Uncharacterized protein n=1 Tax=Noviherbaspirillum galbum TaxID=2709383 RepID=A0A6B3SXW4_9BURK|nr:hypothetical protein [Noviherbaspirillum galbum]NEX63402.1 hypothetical protein [Noviherbaspirillum galbum]
MKDVIAYTAGVALISYVGYIFISPDEPTRANRACIPAAAATRLLGSVVRLVDEDSGESMAKGKPQQVLSACRTAVWYWAKDSRNPPVFPNDDALFGSFADKTYGAKAAEPSGTPATAQPAASSASGAASGASAAPIASPSPLDDAVNKIKAKTSKSSPQKGDEAL